MIDHIYMSIEPRGPEIDYFASLGLVETYRRTHPGQGTENVCYAFDNLFLELLWITDTSAVRSPSVQRTGLYERSLWRTNGACPFGIAWRRSPADKHFAPPTWHYTPPYLPAGITIPIATDSDGPRQPLLFESPGATAPVEWPSEKQKGLQHAAGLGAVTEIRLAMPTDPSPTLSSLAHSGTPPLHLNHPSPYSLQVTVASTTSSPSLLITLPLSS